MVTQTTSLLHDIEEYFTDHDVKPGVYPRLDPVGLLRRAHELIEDLEDKTHHLEDKTHHLERRIRNIQIISDDNDDS
jgi:hypothetical protein